MRFASLTRRNYVFFKPNEESRKTVFIKYFPLQAVKTLTR